LRAFLLLHGFTDSPAQFQEIAAHLFDNGDNVYVPRVPHHAQRDAPLRALGLLRAGELEAFGDSALDIAAALGDTVVVVGLSARPADTAGKHSRSERRWPTAAFANPAGIVNLGPGSNVYRVSGSLGGVHEAEPWTTWSRGRQRAVHWRRGVQQ
jgi:alpha-beta hydrolase superfamily lysophospholipase